MLAGIFFVPFDKRSTILRAAFQYGKQLALRLAFLNEDHHITVDSRQSPVVSHQWPVVSIGDFYKIINDFPLQYVFREITSY
jgi:hypothetical protein